MTTEEAWKRGSDAVSGKRGVYDLVELGEAVLWAVERIEKLEAALEKIATMPGRAGEIAGEVLES